MVPAKKKQKIQQTKTNMQNKNSNKQNKKTETPNTYRTNKTKQNKQCRGIGLVVNNIMMNLVVLPEPVLRVVAEEQPDCRSLRNEDTFLFFKETKNTKQKQTKQNKTFSSSSGRCSPRSHSWHFSCVSGVRCARNKTPNWPTHAVFFGVTLTSFFFLLGRARLGAQALLDHVHPLCRHPEWFEQVVAPHARHLLCSHVPPHVCGARIE